MTSPAETPAAPSLDGARVCLVTPAHLSTNPRLVKEADALAGAGADVRVIACTFAPWAEAADRVFADRPWWPPEGVRFGPLGGPVPRTFYRLRQRAARVLALRTGLPPPLALRALHPVIPELTRHAQAEPADLYIAHNLEALPAALAAARRHGARLGFDAEDFHRGQYADPDVPVARLTRWAEARYIPACDYVTAASDGIAEAYAEALGIPRPPTVLNVFPRAERDVTLPPDEIARERPPGTRTLYWFSQTIGGDRGLEQAVDALAHLPADLHLALRGNPAAGYREALTEYARARGVPDRLRFLPAVPPNEMVARAACHDVGLALEPGHTINNNLAVSNKLFTYLLAGTPVAATATRGQHALCTRLPGATALVTDTATFVSAVEHLLTPQARQAAQSAAERFTWEAEQSVFLDAVRGVLGRARTAREPDLVQMA
jgi:glycosyltransferase involved in cell wall biosynthesis